MANPVRAATLEEQAAAAWAKRDQPGQIQAAAELWKRADLENPKNGEILVRLTQACDAAYRNTTSGREKRSWADQALGFGQKAVDENPRDSWAHAYFAEALGQYAQAHKGLSGLQRVKQAMSQLRQAVELDPRNAYAYMLMSEFYRGAPRGISIGDKGKALTMARLAVRFGPDRAINHLTLAKALMANGRKSEATRELLVTLALVPPPDNLPETRSDQAAARDILRRLGVQARVSPGRAFDADSCRQLGGRWTQTGLHQLEACNFPTHEEQQACHDSSECQVACVGDSEIPAGEAATGHCAGWTNRTGRCDNDVVNGKAMGTICWD
ncbi:MAG TPA: hypothetical protein VMU17_03640 [Elusimicrobiota bacterium]|nr:hypothetical protein [Elusimicrobiota bacterium]